MTKTIQRLFLFALIFSPIAFGARAQWSFGIVSAAVFSGFLLLLIQKRSKQEPLYKAPGTLPLILFCLWIFVQIIPFPPWLIGLISEGTFTLYQNTAGTIEPNSWISLSINKQETLSEFFRYSTYAVFYIFMVQLLKDSDFLKKTVQIVTFLSAFLAIFAILQYFISGDRIYWFREVPKNATPFGPYIYHNHFAGFMEMTFPLALCLFLYYKPRLSYHSFRERLFELFNHPKINLHMLYGFWTIIIGASVFVSYSRGGIISLCLSMVFLAIMMTGFAVRKEGQVLFSLVIILILFSVGWFGWDPIFDRFERIRNAEGVIQDSRIPVWEDSMNIVREYPLTGTGFGTFVHIYPSYRTAKGNLIFDHAHNDYLEILSNGGVVGAFLFFCFLFSFFYKTYQKVKKRHDSLSIFLYLGSITGIVAILIHSITDFNLQNGANGLYFFFLAGLGVSSINTRMRTLFSQTYLPKSTMAMPWEAIFLTSILLVATSVFNFSGVMGKYHFAQIRDISLDADLSKNEAGIIQDKAYKASQYEPLNAQYHYGIANIELYLSNFEKAKKHYKKAVLLNPAKGEYLQRLGFILSMDSKSITAAKLIEAGIQTDIKNPDRYRDYAAWLGQKRQRQRSIREFRQSLILDTSKEYMNHCISLMKKYKFNENEIYRSIPQRCVSHLLYGDYLIKNNDISKLEMVYQKAIELVDNDMDPKPWYFYKIVNYYRKNEQQDKALKVMQQAIRIFPDNINIRLMAGDLYQKSGIKYRAKEEYQNALIIDSASIPAKRRLASITQ